MAEPTKKDESKFVSEADNIGIGKVEPCNDFTFAVDNGNTELIKITKGSFFWKGEEVKDVDKIYERFSEWMSRREE